MATKTEETEKVTTKTIPEDERPNLNDGVSFGEDLGDEPELDLETYPDATPEHPLGFLPNGEPRKRRKRGTAGKPRAAGTINVPRGKNALRVKAAAGASIMYGGIGVALAGSGFLPAAGMSMQGLADEAGEPIALWAEKRSPRFFQFLASLSDAAGIGKYVAAPVCAEGYVRLPPARPALAPIVEFAHGKDGLEAFNDMSRARDEWVMQQAFSDEGIDTEEAA